MSKKMSDKPPVAPLVVAAVAAASMTLTACNDDDSVQVNQFDNPEVCMQTGRSWDECKTSWDQAVRQHIENSKRYKTIEECEIAENKKCGDESQIVVSSNDNPSSTTSSGSSSMTAHHSNNSFLPYMWGYYMGRSSAGDHYAGPVYQGNKGTVTKDNIPFNKSANGTSSVSKTFLSPQPTSQPMSNATTQRYAPSSTEKEDKEARGGGVHGTTVRMPPASSRGGFGASAPSPSSSS